MSIKESLLNDGAPARFPMQQAIKVGQIMDSRGFASPTRD
jgi:hypothetical protein